MLSTRTEPAVKAYHSPRVRSVWPADSGTEKLAGRLGHREIGLVGLIPDRSIAQLVLVVPGRGHPRTFTGAAAVVLPKIPPGANPILGDIGVTEIAVEKMEQWLQLLHAERGIAGRGRAEIVVH